MSDTALPLGESPESSSNTSRETGRIGLYIVLTLIGGTMLITSFVANTLFPKSDPGGNAYAAFLGLIAAVMLGAPIIKWAFDELRAGKAHMNVLVALAVLAACATYAFQEAAAIAFFMIISGLIERRTAVGAQASIESLVRITPTRAYKLVDDGEVEVDASKLRPGDVVRVRPGDNIPADGEVVTGQSTVNQANITGESLPADKSENDEVFGGTINLTGQMDIRVTKAGSDTTLGRVKELILEAEKTRIPIMRMIDRYAGSYTPAVMMIVAVVYMFLIRRDDVDDAASRAIAMLVVACPAALILATPTAMVAALSAAARLGVLVKSVTDLEAARNLTAMVFDKTGTLTTGQLQVTALTPVPDVEGADLLRTAAIAEQGSRHPVARAVTDVARRAKLRLPDATEFHETAGRGVRAVCEGHTIVVGRGTWVVDPSTAQLSPEAIERVNKAFTSSDSDGLSLLFVVRDNQLLGWIGLADNTRPEAVSAMNRLRELGLKRLIIVTGDRESVARRIAGQMHAEYKAEVLPSEKLEIVDDLKSRGHRVAMIGDGVNDAPALAAGDISIAMGAAGSDVAIKSAKIALMNNNLNRIPFLINLSKLTSNVIRQNLGLGIGFIIVFLILAGMGYVSPITAAFLHVVSGLIVVFNSARLVRSGEDIELNEAKSRPGQSAAVARAT